MGIVSPPELIRAILLADIDVLPLAGDRIAVGPLTEAQAALGGISLSMLPGAPESSTLVMSVQIEASCQAPTVAAADLIGTAVYLALHGKGRRVIAQANGHTYLVHLTRATTPVLRQAEDGESWDVAVIVQALIGIDFAT
jgi:hypothetical protein